MSNYPVVALRANDISFVGINRALHQLENIDLYSVVFSWEGAARWYSDESEKMGERVEITNPAQDSVSALNDLLSLGQKLFDKYQRKALVICSSDTNQVFFFENEEVLSPYFCLPGSPTYNDFRSDVADKGHFFDLLQKSCPELIPQSMAFRGVKDISKLQQWSKFPCILKPTLKDLSQSFYREHNGDKAVLCENIGQLTSRLTHLLNKGYSILLQDFIEFGSELDEMPTYTYFDKQNKLRIFANCIKDVIYPPKFGTAISLRMSYAPDLVEPSKKVARALNWNGPLMIEFVRDRRDESLKVLEVNTRPWLFHDFYRQSGLPFVVYCAKEFSKQLVDSDQVIYPEQSVLNNRNVDLISMAAFFEDQYDYSSINKTQEFIDFCKGSAKGLYFAHHDPLDPKPLLNVLQDISNNHEFDYDSLIEEFKLKSTL